MKPMNCKYTKIFHHILMRSKIMFIICPYEETYLHVIL